MVKSNNPLEARNLNMKKIIKTYPKMNECEMEGMILGGNLDVLSLLKGTKYDNMKAFNEKYKDEGIIWYFEACDLNVISIRRAIFALKEADWFKYTKGFLIGRPMMFNEKIMGINQYNACIDILKDFNVPILMDVDLGHLEPSLPMINGLNAKVTYKNNNIQIEYR